MKKDNLEWLVVQKPIVISDNDLEGIVVTLDVKGFNEDKYRFYTLDLSVYRDPCDVTKEEKIGRNLYKIGCSLWGLEDMTYKDFNKFVNEYKTKLLQTFHQYHCRALVSWNHDEVMTATGWFICTYLLCQCFYNTPSRKETYEYYQRRKRHLEYADYYGLDLSKFTALTLELMTDPL